MNVTKGKSLLFILKNLPVLRPLVIHTMNKHWLWQFKIRKIQCSISEFVKVIKLFDSFTHKNIDWQQNWTKMKRSKKNRLNFHCHLTIEMSFIRTFGFSFIKYKHMHDFGQQYSTFIQMSHLLMRKMIESMFVRRPTKLMDFASIYYELFGCRTIQPILLSFFYFDSIFWLRNDFLFVD